MPLDADQGKRFVNQRLNALILRAPLYGTQAFPQTSDGLMVGAVDDGSLPV